MCGRFLVEFSEEELREIIASAEKGADERSDHLSFTFKGGEIFPCDATPVITANGVRLMTWGFPNVILDKAPHINARCETAVKSKTFGEAMASRRCLIPASAFYEWKDVNILTNENIYHRSCSLFCSLNKATNRTVADNRKVVKKLNFFPDKPVYNDFIFFVGIVHY